MKKIPSYEIIGSREKALAIVDMPDEFQDKERQIAEEILKRHKNVRSVLKKVSARKGIFRTREYEFLLGDKNTEVIHIEHGCRLKLDPQKVYFSPREGTERLRIANQIKPNETIMLMFSGIGSYAIMISKKQPKVKKIISVEINPVAFEYMKENIRMNRLGDKILPVLGNVKEKCKGWHGKCDRVIMPLPREAFKFLDVACDCLKSKGGIIHLYLIEREENLQKKVKDLVDELKKKTKKSIDCKTKKVSPYAPRVNKYCIDIELF
ncbi:MAG: class I SAM-dependent methyltransferase family protein [Candidatus Aenigmarchaeota archaeon]|nr:class I SAM-dependent methyltransferase family protein [Candidatus Aenigmarchaeota archaeon]